MRPPINLYLPGTNARKKVDLDMPQESSLPMGYFAESEFMGTQEKLIKETERCFIYDI